MNNHKKYVRERERERETSDGDRERERRLLEKRVTGTEREREREKRLLEKRVTGTERARERETSGREGESVTHAAFPLSTIPYPDTPKAISQHPCDIRRLF